MTDFLCPLGDKTQRVAITFTEVLSYETFDDYGIVDDLLWFAIKDTHDPFLNRMMLIHAMIEQFLTSMKGIKAETIDEFDLAHPNSEEPGDEVDAPYRDEHSIAYAVERLLCAYLGIPWKVYEDRLARALEG